MVIRNEASGDFDGIGGRQSLSLFLASTIVVLWFFEPVLVFKRQSRLGNCLDSLLRDFAENLSANGSVYRDP
jgi:hypothetical protein